MKLIDHLKKRGESIPDFAERADEKFSTIRKIAYAQRQPSLPLAVKISELCDGEVTPADLLIERAGGGSPTP